MISERDYEVLSAYVDGQLDERDRKTLEARLADDRELRHTLKALRQDKLLLQKLPALRAPRNFTLTAAQAAAIRPRRKRGFFSFSAFSAMRVVTGVASLLFVTLLGLDLARSGGLAQPQAAPVADYAAPQASSLALEEASQATPEVAGIQIAETPTDMGTLYATGPMTDSFAIEGPASTGMGGGLETPTVTVAEMTGKIAGNDAAETLTVEAGARTMQETAPNGDVSVTTLSQLADETPQPTLDQRDPALENPQPLIQPWTIAVGVAVLVLAGATLALWLTRRSIG